MYSEPRAGVSARRRGAGSALAGREGRQLAPSARSAVCSRPTYHTRSQIDSTRLMNRNQPDSRAKIDTLPRKLKIELIHMAIDLLAAIRSQYRLAIYENDS